MSRLRRLFGSLFGKKTFDCSKYNKREGQSCDLNNLCKYPNCSFKKNDPEADLTVSNRGTVNTNI